MFCQNYSNTEYYVSYCYGNPRNQIINEKIRKDLAKLIEEHHELINEHYSNHYKYSAKFTSTYQSDGYVTYLFKGEDHELCYEPRRIDLNLKLIIEALKFHNLYSDLYSYPY